MKQLVMISMLCSALYADIIQIEPANDLIQSLQQISLHNEHGELYMPNGNRALYARLTNQHGQHSWAAGYTNEDIRLFINLEKMPEVKFIIYYTSLMNEQMPLQ